MTLLNPKNMNFALVRAPLAQVTAATGGIMRADGNGAIVNAEVAQPDMRALHPNGRYGLRQFALVAPVGDAVLVEFCYMHNVPAGLTLMLPDCEVLSFRSNWETKTRGYDQFKVYRAGEVLRMVDVEQGWETTRLTVTKEGEPYAFEPDTWPRSKRKWLDQAALLAMADRAVPGCRAAMESRAFSKVTSFAAFSSLDAMRDDLTKHRTSLFQAEYEAARRLGIGNDEKDQIEMQSQNDWVDHFDALTDYAHRYFAGLERVKPDPVKVRQYYDMHQGDPARPSGFVMTPMQLTQGLDRAGNPEALAYLDAEAMLWERALELNGRIQQTVWSQPGYENLSLSETDDVPAQAVLRLKTGAYDDIDQAVRHEASKALKSAGVDFDPDAKVFSKAQTLSAYALNLFRSGDDFKETVNGELTSDLTIGKPRLEK